MTALLLAALLQDVEEFTKAIEKNPKDAASYRGRAGAYFLRGQLDKSVDDFARAIQLEPRDAKALYGRGMVLYVKGSRKESIADFRASCEADPKTQDFPRFGVWMVESAFKERDVADTELRRYLKDSKSEGWPAKIGAFLVGDLAEAEFLKAAESKEEQCQAYFYAGTRRLHDGEKEKARAHFKKCAETEAKGVIEFAAAAAELKK